MISKYKAKDKNPNKGTAMHNRYKTLLTRNTAFIKIRNKLLLCLGFTLVNKHGHTVHLVKGQQIMSNPKRVKPYSLDDPSWSIQKG